MGATAIAPVSKKTLTMPLCIVTLLLSCNILLAEQDFIRGDVNTTGYLDLSDAVVSLNFMFAGGSISCLDSADVNDDGGVDISDAVYLLGYLFIPGSPLPPSPFPWCGDDPTTDNLYCDENLNCSLGGPIDGLSASELDSFHRGRVLMSRNFKPSEGMGPLYNATSCTACHSTPAVGGSAPLYRNFFFLALGDTVASQAPHPDLPSFVVPAYHTTQGPRPKIETVGGVGITVAQRNSPPLFGTGLFEFIPNSEIQNNMDPDDLIIPDGISGRFNTGGGGIGRFGYKLQANFIEPFIRGALFNQMGLTSDPVEGSTGIVNLAMKLQVGSGLDDPTTDNDSVPDPEMSVSDLADLITFCRFLAPPAKADFGPDEIAGEVLFEQIGCTDCHVPSLDSSLGPVEAYTDLLLHNMGPDLADGIRLGIPLFSTIDGPFSQDEFRTQPLWGVSMHAPYLHDGRADTLDQAITMHGGEALTRRQAYEALTPSERAQIIKFLEAL